MSCRNDDVDDYITMLWMLFDENPDALEDFLKNILPKHMSKESIKNIALALNEKYD